MLPLSHLTLFAISLLALSSPIPAQELSPAPAVDMAPAFAPFDLDCRVDGPNPTCEGSAVTYNSAFPGSNYVWSLSAPNTPNNTAGASFCGPTNAQSVCVTTAQTGSFRLQLDYVLQSGPKTCAAIVIVNPVLAIHDLSMQD